METNRILSTRDKNKNNKQWYKDTLDSLEQKPFYSNVDATGLDKRDIQINYNLFNGEINKEDFEYVYKPLGEGSGDLPADFTNKDIISTKLKALMGMELERPFTWRINAVNPEATTRKEEAKFSKMREYVVQQIMSPIEQQIELKYSEQLKGEELTPDEQQQIRNKIEQEKQALTPPQVEHYMRRRHQDPVEIMMTQIFRYVSKKEEVDEKFNRGWKDSLIAGAQIYWTGIINDEPVLRNINPMDFQGSSVGDSKIEDSEWAGVDLWMSPTEVNTMFNDELTNAEMEDIYKSNVNESAEGFWYFDGTSQREGKIKVVHRTWRALRKMGFLIFIDPNTGQMEERIVNEGYKLNTEAGDVGITWEQIPEVYEGYKINNKYYKKLRPIPAQPKDMDNLYNVKLPYMGGFVDARNNKPTSLIDRVKTYQYYYNIIMYRIEMLMASDKGKLLLLNMNLIPNSQNIDMKKWLYYADSLKIGFMNPSEEGNRGPGQADVSNAAKEIDMSLISDIQKYISLADFIEKRAGDVIGVTEEMVGRVGQYQAVKNTEAALAQGSYVVEPYFSWHNMIKRNVLTQFIELSALAYSYNGKETLDYILDDFSREIIRLDKSMLSLSKFGLFVTNSMDAVRVKEAVANLSLTAMQNQTLDMSDVIKIMKTDSITEAEETLEVAEARKREEAKQEQQAQREHETEIQKRMEAENEKQHQRNIELIVVKEEEERKTEIQKQTIMSMGFNENKDMDGDGVPDVLEVAKFGVDADLKMRKQDLDERKFEQQKKTDTQKAKHDEEKLKADKQKAKQKTTA